jgi:hypothetical protein
MILPQKALALSCFRVFVVILGLSIPFSGEAQSLRPVLWGTDTGLYSRSEAGSVELSWSGGKVQKIIPLGASGWALLTDQGVWVSPNLKNWEKRVRGLPERVIKIYENGKKSLVSTAKEIKDLKIDPKNPEIMVCALKNAVYLSQNGGRDWENLGMPNFKANGIKAVAVSSVPELTVFCSHSIYGIAFINPRQQGAKWNEINTGLEKLETSDNPDEISDIILDSDSVYASQSFRPRLYKLNWENKSWKLLWNGGPAFGVMDSLQAGGNSITFVRDGWIGEIGIQGNGRANFRLRQDLAGIIRAIPGNSRPNCAVLSNNAGSPGAAGSGTISLSELWLLDEVFPVRPAGSNSRLAEAAGKEGLYLPVNHSMDPGSLRPYLDIIEKRKLNMVVIDMKDDYGRLRFTPQNPSINLGRVFRPVDIDALIKTMKERRIYTVARIVVFKDPEAAAKDGGKYAVWDARSSKPWEGYYDTRRKKTSGPQEAEPSLLSVVLPDPDPNYEILRSWYDEKWVDPYSEEIWEYNALVAEELHRRGFDEIQFDYIRFPTDGLNLADARYRWQEGGMDMDSAILSFLAHVRSRISAPISIDIYGANGWYRTGARTGQEVELLAPYVDVICPMYYPSHFEQTFLAQDPPEFRPYRIYYQGSLRTHTIARGRVIVRPWAQAFFLNVSYDRKYYSPDYVRLQAEGARAAGNGGLTYWNNSGRYEDIPYR